MNFNDEGIIFTVTVGYFKKWDMFYFFPTLMVEVLQNHHNF